MTDVMITRAGGGEVALCGPKRLRTLEDGSATDHGLWRGANCVSSVDVSANSFTLRRLSSSVSGAGGLAASFRQPSPQVSQNSGYPRLGQDPRRWMWFTSVANMAFANQPASAEQRNRSQVVC